MADLDINSLLDSLSEEDMENLKKTASSLLNGSDISGLLGGIGNQKKTADSATAEKPEKYTDGGDIFKSLSELGMPDLSTLNSLTPLLRAVNSRDERIDFINALKPLLSGERQKKADEAVKLVKLLSVLPLLKERGLM